MNEQPPTPAGEDDSRLIAELAKLRGIEPSPNAKTTFHQRMADDLHASPQARSMPWWRRSIRVPVPVCLAAGLALVALLVWKTPHAPLARPLHSSQNRSCSQRSRSRRSRFAALTCWESASSLPRLIISPMRTNHEPTLHRARMPAPFVSAFLLSVLLASVTNLAVRADDVVPIRTGWLDVAFYSIDPAKGIESYRPGSKGGSGLGGTFGATVDVDGAELTIHVSARQRDGKLLAELKTEKQVGDVVTHPPELNREIDLTNLVPFAYELGRDPSGLVQRLTIVPSLKAHPAPKQFRLSDLDLADFNLSRLPVILNEQEFIGTAGVDGGEVISLQIAGLAEIEFSLHPFPEAVPTGELHGGTLTLRHDQDQLQISGVTNGDRKEILPGGPYQVFLRWRPPTLSLQEYADSLQQQLAEFGKLAEQGDQHAKLLLPKLTTMTEVVTAAIKSKSTTAQLYGSGARQLSKKEREKK